jgi:catechol 2,3-dioxygenase-like lactoylglutathione lyase family enzyme
MKARLSVLTLGVDDLERSVSFYRDGLGCRPKASWAGSSSMEPLRSSS